MGEKDMEMVNIFNAVGASYQVVLTKIDELENNLRKIKSPKR